MSPLWGVGVCANVLAKEESETIKNKITTPEQQNPVLKSGLKPGGRDFRY